LLRPFAKVKSFVNFRLPSSLRSADSKAAALRVKTYHRVGVSGAVRMQQEQQLNASFVGTQERQHIETLFEFKIQGSLLSDPQSFLDPLGIGSCSFSSRNISSLCRVCTLLMFSCSGVNPSTACMRVISTFAYLQQQFSARSTASEPR
jgi:hypothetical protein